MITWIATWIIRPIIKFLDLLAPLGDLAARAWVSWIFFKSGLVKVESWKSTLLLFQYQYHVPVISAKVAAVIGTGAELALPVLLFLGLGGRIIIGIFFVYNIVAAASYPFLWTAEGAVGLAQHISWGLLLALLMFHGPGKLSIDYFIRRRHISNLRDKISHTDGL